MKLRHIEIFHAIMTYGSVNAAAQHLNTSQPALSVALKQMEDALGYRLFDRRGGRLHATQKAAILLEQSSKVVQEVEVFSRLASNLGKTVDYSFSIGVIPALTFSVLPMALADYRNYQPDIHLSVRTVHFNQARELMAKRDLSLAFVFYRGELLDGMIDLGQAPLVLVTPKNVENIEDLPLINTANSGPVGSIASNYMASDKVKPRSTLEVDTYHMAISMVKHGHGYTVLDALTANALAGENVTIRPIVGLEHVRIGAFIDKEEASNRRLQTLIRCVREKIAEQPDFLNRSRKKPGK